MIFARVSIYQIPAGRSDEAVESFQAAFGQIASKEGLRSYSFLVDAEEGRAIAMTFWDSYDAMAATRVTASRLRTDAARAVGGSVVSVEELSVPIHEEAGAERLMPMS